MAAEELRSPQGGPRCLRREWGPPGLSRVPATPRMAEPRQRGPPAPLGSDGLPRQPRKIFPASSFLKSTSSLSVQGLCHTRSHRVPGPAPPSLAPRPGWSGPRAAEVRDRSPASSRAPVHGEEQLMLWLAFLLFVLPRRGGRWAQRQARERRPQTSPAPAERRRNEFRSTSRPAPRRNTAAEGAAARMGRRGTGETLLRMAKERGSGAEGSMWGWPWSVPPPRRQ